MDKLFEDVVGNGLQRAGRPLGVAMRTQYHDRLDVDGRLGIDPDLVWLSDDRVCAVDDVKYKLPVKPEDVNEDVYQVLAYTARTASTRHTSSMPRGHRSTPSTSPVRPSTSTMST